MALKTERQETNAQVIALLERALEEARNGEIVAVRLAVVRPSPAQLIANMEPR